MNHAAEGLTITACNATEEALSWLEDDSDDEVKALLIRAYNLLNAARKQIRKTLEDGPNPTN